MAVARSVPQKGAFNDAEKYNKNLSRLEATAFVVSILGTIISYLSFFAGIYETIFAMISVLCTVSVFYFQRRFAVTYQKAEDIRRDGLLDSAFGTKMADIQSDGYYDTTEVADGLRKLLANIHENSFLSTRVLEPTFKRKEVYGLVAFVILVIVAVFSTLSSQVFLAVLQLFLSMSFLGDYYRLKELQGSINEVQMNCKRIWDEFEQNGKKKMTLRMQGEIVREVIRYETALAYASMMFDQKVYDNVNASSTAEWAVMKQRYKM